MGWNETTQPPDIVAEADRLYSQALSTADLTQRVSIEQELDMHLLEYGPYVGVAQATNHVAYNARLSGVFWGPKNIFSSIWFIQWTS